MRILVLGGQGMLGHTVTRYLIDHYGEDSVSFTHRDDTVAWEEHRIYFNALEDDIDDLPKCDYVINCIGVIKPFMMQDLYGSVAINALLPMKLADWCKNCHTKLIHITTDCVYSGSKGNYVESDPHDALDEYGKSKSLGDSIADRAMVIRTSIIGREYHKQVSLLEWALKQRGKDINGFVTHHWNGMTTNQYAKVCMQIIDQNLFEEGLFHIFSEKVTKFELMGKINRIFDLNMTITEKVVLPVCDRSLSTTKSLCGKLDIPSLDQQLQETSSRC